MNNLREVNDDEFRDWLILREEEICLKLSNEDKNHLLIIDDVIKNILNNIPNENKDYVKRQLNMLDDNIMDYIGYWNEKYYRNGFCDGMEFDKESLKQL